MTNIKQITCPTCDAPATWRPDNKFRPFCSERCKLIDLGDWADEKHRIAGDPASTPPLDQHEDD